MDGYMYDRMVCCHECFIVFYRVSVGCIRQAAAETHNHTHTHTLTHSKMGKLIFY